MSSVTLRTLRFQAWERAKGELQSMLVTFWDHHEPYDEVKEKVEAFIKDLEENELG